MPHMSVTVSQTNQNGYNRVDDYDFPAANTTMSQDDQEVRGVLTFTKRPGHQLNTVTCDAQSYFTADTEEGGSTNYGLDISYSAIDF